MSIRDKPRNERGKRRGRSNTLSTPNLALSRAVPRVTETEVTNLIGDIYEAALDLELWPDLLTRLSDAMGGTTCSNLFIFDPANKMAVNFMTSARIDPNCIGPYVDHYHHADIWAQALVQLGPCEVATNGSLFPPGKFESSEWYNEFLTEIDLFHICSSSFPMEHGQKSILSFYRPPGQTDFGKDEARLYQLVAPHAYRALQLSLRFNLADRKASNFLGLLDSLTYGVLLLGADGQVIEQNRLASSLLTLENGLVISAGFLEAVVPSVNKKLQETIRLVLAESIIDSNCGGCVIPIYRIDRVRPLVITVNPMPQSHAYRCNGFTRDCPAAIVLIRDCDAVPEFPAEMLQRLYDLTRAEANLAAKLADGFSLTKAADHLGISKETARSQLKAIYSKTDTHRQAELVRLILTTTVV